MALGREQRKAWSLASIDAATAVQAERTDVLDVFERWLSDRG
jgi:hypothetical protein